MGFAIAGVTLKAARLVVIQDTGTDPLTATESQYEIGNRETGVTVTATSVLQKLAAPKYWKYESANFDGACIFYGECTYLVSSTTGNKTIVVQEATSAEPTATWTTVATMLNNSTGSITAARVRSSAFTPVDGRYYRLAFSNSSTMSTVSIYNAKIIVDQNYSTQTFIDDSSASNISSGFAQSFLGDGTVLAKFSAMLLQSGSGTGTIIAKLYAHSGTFGGVSSVPTGAALDTSASITVSTLPGTKQWVDFTFSGGFTLVNGTAYFISLEVSVSNSTAWQDSSNSVAGTTAQLAGGVWSFFSTIDKMFIVNTTKEITKTEDHYLLANTTLTAGTALQNFLTKWDSAEWSGVDNSYVHQVDAGDNNTSVVELDGITSGSAVTNSSVSSPDNYKQSTSALTMPSSQNLDVKATTNSGSVFGSRIIVKSVKSVIASIPNKIYQINQSINRASNY